VYSAGARVKRPPLDHVSSLDQAQAHVAEALGRVAGTFMRIDRSTGCLLRSDERLKASIERVARGHVRRSMHRARGGQPE
jgi:hypothetical protein